MRGSHSKKAPSELTDWLASEGLDWSPSYPFPTKIRKHVDRALLDAQRGLCVYCGRKLNTRRAGKSYHIEHFRPRSSYPELETHFTNLFLSCGQEDKLGGRSEICGTAKENWFNEAQHVEPHYPDCTNRFRFSLSGQVVPESDSDAAAREMINRLNLNHPELKQDREDILNRIDSDMLDISDFVDAENRIVMSYAHMVCRHLDTVIP